MRARGFTLVELVITVAIVGLLATAAFPMLQMAARRAQEQELRLALQEIRDALDAYRAAVGEGRITVEVGGTGYPPNLDVLADGVQDARDPDGSMIYFLRRVPRDPFHPDPSAPASAIWGLRSYASPPEDPQPGEDVFDVYSLSPGVGLNGVPYREW